MKANDLPANLIKEKTFLIEYEFRINKLKFDFSEIMQTEYSAFHITNRFNPISPGNLIASKVTEVELEVDSELYSKQDSEQNSVSHSQCAISLARQNFQSELSSLRSLVQDNASIFDVFSCSSLNCIPTRLIDADERNIHRIWMGGAPTELARQAMTQWGCALDQVKAAGNLCYQSILWVWNEAQLANDPGFIAKSTDEHYAIGLYVLENQLMLVKSLQQLSNVFSGLNADLIDILHEKKYFATLSDYFRFIIVINFGGIYMDIDTIPHKLATVFLAKPEVPDYIYSRSGTTAAQLNSVSQFHVSWMNLFFDETGMIIAKKNDPSLMQISEKMKQHYLSLSREVPEKCNDFELRLFEQFYAVWESHIGVSFLSFNDFYQNYNVLNDGRKEEIICGIRGMRLLYDITTNLPMPLSQQEQLSYQRCVHALDSVDWTLENPLDLEQFAEVFTVIESPRLAFPAQLRSDIDHYHYYSVLSDDKILDRVNGLFCNYLVARAKQSIAGNDFWVQTKGVACHGWLKQSVLTPNQVNFIEESRCMHNEAESDLSISLLPGNLANEQHKNRMAELIFATSYLEYCSYGNKLNLPFMELQRKQNIDQYIDFTYGLYDASENFIGFFSAGRMDQFLSHPAVSFYRDEMLDLDSAYEKFLIKNSQASDYFLCSVAFEEKQRGKGYFNTLLEKIKSLALQKKCPRIVLTSWGKSELSKLAMNGRYGFQVLDVYDYAYNLFFDKLYFIEMKL